MNAGYLDTNMIVILNDNKQVSLPTAALDGPAPPVGALSSALSRLQSSRPLRELREVAKDLQKTTSAGKSEAKSETPVPTEAKTEVVKVDVSQPDSAKKGEADASKPTVTPTKPADVVPDNEFEKRIRPEVIPASEIGVSFEDIGALENVKDSLQELVMLPLRRPELFNKGGLIKRCKALFSSGLQEPGKPCSLRQ